MSNRPSVEEVKAAAAEKQRAFKRLFKTPDGKVVLENLRDEFARVKLNVPGDSHSSHVRIGNYEVVQYIETIMESEDAT